MAKIELRGSFYFCMYYPSHRPRLRINLLWNRLLLERYLFGQMAWPVVAGAAGGTLLLTAGRLFALADKLVIERVPAIDVLKLLVLDLPSTVVLAMPIAAMFATMLTLSKLSSNSEITALRAAGVPFRRLFVPVLVVGLVMSLVSFGFSNLLVPRSRQEIRTIDQRSVLAQFQQLQKQDVFFKTKDNLWFFIRAINPQLNTMQDVTILKVLPGPQQVLSEVILAGEALWNGQDWTLGNGVIHRYGLDGRTIAEIPFRYQKLDVSEDLATLIRPQAAPSELSLPDLGQRIVSLSRSNLKTQDLRTEWHMRFSLPLASLFAVLISLPLATQTSRRVGRYGGVVRGILLVFIYYIILNISRSLGEAGAIPPWIAAWSHNFLFGGVGMLLLLRFLR